MDVERRSLFGLMEGFMLGNSKRLKKLKASAMSSFEVKFSSIFLLVVDINSENGCHQLQLHGC